MNPICLKVSAFVYVAASALLSACGGGDSAVGESVTVVKLAARKYDAQMTPQEVVREVDALRAAGVDTAHNATCHVRFEAQPFGTFFLMVEISADQVPIAKKLNLFPLSEFTSSNFTAIPCANL